MWGQCWGVSVNNALRMIEYMETQSQVDLPHFIWPFKGYHKEHSIYTKEEEEEEEDDDDDDDDDGGGGDDDDDDDDGAQYGLPSINAFNPFTVIALIPVTFTICNPKHVFVNEHRGDSSNLFKPEIFNACNLEHLLPIARRPLFPT